MSSNIPPPYPAPVQQADLPKDQDRAIVFAIIGAVGVVFAALAISIAMNGSIGIHSPIIDLCGSWQVTTSVAGGLAVLSFTINHIMLRQLKPPVVKPTKEPQPQDISPLRKPPIPPRPVLKCPPKASPPPSQARIDIYQKLIAASDGKRSSPAQLEPLTPPQPRTPPPNLLSGAPFPHHPTREDFIHPGTIDQTVEPPLAPPRSSSFDDLTYA